MLTTHRLRLLVELHRRGTLTEVARALDYSPSTISQQLAQLEVEAGSKLLEQVGRRVRLTRAGELLVKHGELVMIQLERAEAELAAARSDISGTIRVATFQTAAVALLPAMLAAMKRLHPAVSVFVSEIQPDQGSAALLAREFDLVLGELYPGARQPPSDVLHIELLLADPLRVYASEALAAGRASLAVFADLPWVMEPTGKPARTWAESICRSAGFEPVVQFESADLLVQVRLSETGHAVAFLPDLVWAGRRRDGRLLPIPGRPARRIYTAVRSGAEERPTLKEFRRIIRDVVADVARDLP